MIGVDLGCGDLRDPGFIGVDLRPGPQVNVVADMDFGLPFRDDSVDVLFASHSLEHVQDLVRTMREIYRVCKHGARVCIVAPYYEQKINFANPYHKVAFNEHTPRFWTAHRTSGVPQSEYWHPHAGEWGLSRSDRSDPGIDFRCERIEYFYFPEYRSLSDEEKRTLRKQLLDVCDQIVISLYVVKSADDAPPPLTEATLPEPSHVTIRRLKEELEGARSVLATRTAEATALRQEKVAIESARQEAERQRAAEREELEQRRERALLEVVKDYSVRLERATDEAKVKHAASLTALGSSLQDRLQEIVRAKADIDELRRALHSDRLSLASMRGAAMRTAGQLNLLLSSRLLTLYRRFFWGDDDLWPNLSPAFLPLKQSEQAWEAHGRGFCLALGPNLQALPFREYPLQAPPGGLSRISVALIVDVPGGPGDVGVEIVSPEERINAHVRAPLAATTADCVRSFALPEIALGRQRGWRVRLFARGCDAPVRPLEFQRRRWLGVRRPHVRGFYLS